MENDSAPLFIVYLGCHMYSYTNCRNEAAHTYNFLVVKMGDVYDVCIRKLKKSLGIYKAVIRHRCEDMLASELAKTSGVRDDTIPNIVALKKYAFKYGHCHVNKKDEDHSFHKGLGCFTARLREGSRKDSNHFLSLVVLKYVPLARDLIFYEEYKKRKWLERYCFFLRAMNKTGRNYFPIDDEKFSKEGIWLSNQFRDLRIGRLEVWKLHLLLVSGARFQPSATVKMMEKSLGIKLT